MPQIELTLRPRSGASAATAAWYLPGDSPEAWLQEIASWQCDHAALRVVLLRDCDQLTVGGVLAIPPAAGFAVGGHAVAFAKFGNNVFLPADAELFPEPCSREMAELFDGDYFYVWLPGRGLTAAEPDEVLSVSDLLQAPPLATDSWDRAQPGLAFPSRIVGILPTETFSADDVIEGGKDDIGDRSDEIVKLPKAPREPMSGVPGKIGRAAKIGAAVPLLGLAKLGSMIGSMIPTGSGGSGSALGSGMSNIPGLGALGRYANELLNRASEALEQVRHKEIGRLLHMLENNPDEGLKFAIPFGGDQHRGRAAPGGRLGERNISFSLGNLGGGGPVDYWDMSWEYQQKLMAKYRDLAAREVRLGRHRRAAYVYAELLGDMQSAASALEQGGHHREAAVLYRERLNNKQAAAECLQRGALWDEAIEAFRELGKHETVGDLCRQIERIEEAEQAFHTAVQQRLDQHDLLDAARIYEEKLEDPALAIKTLDAAWPHSSQARICLHASFAIRARLGFHDDARLLVDRLFADADRLALHADVSELLAETYEKYPEAEVRDHANDLAREIVVHRMRVADRSHVDRFVRTLARLTPDDRLLLRDGQRYRDQRLAKQDQPRAPQPVFNVSKTERLQLINQFSLGLSGAWRAAAAINDRIFAAGVVDGRIVLARCDGAGNVDKNLTPWPKISVPTETQIVLHARRSPISIFAVGENPLPEVRVFSQMEWSAYSVSAGTPKGHGPVFGAAGGSVGQTWSLEMRDDPALVCVGLTGTVVSTRSLLGVDDVPWDFLEVPTPMHVLKDRVLIGVGSALLCVRNNVIEVVERFPSQITGIDGGQPYAAPIFVVSLEAGAVLMRCDSQGYCRPFANEMLSPLSLLNQGQFVIVADENRIEVYENRVNKGKQGDLVLRSELNHVFSKPIALLPTPETDRFIAVFSDGHVCIYQI